MVDPVHGDGLMYRFVLDSRFGSFTAYGRVALALRVREVEALTELARTSRLGLVAGGVGHGVESQVKTATGAVTHPVATVTGIPRGVAHLFRGYQARGEEAVASASRRHAGGGGRAPHGGRSRQGGGRGAQLCARATSASPAPSAAGT